MSGNLSLRLLTIKDVAEVTRLRDEVIESLAHPDFYVRESDESEFVRAHVDAARGSGETIGVFDGSRLVAYGMLGLPHAHAGDNLGRFFCARGESLRVAHLAGCMVGEHYRGQHLQRMLLKARMELARGRGRNFCVAMTSMHNHPSRRNLMREGLCIGWVGELNGLKRQLLAIDLAQPLRFDHQSAQLVGHDDWDRQRELVQQGWWGVGANPYSRAHPPPEHINLVFAKASVQQSFRPEK